ncbi:MAG: AarF/ABC1/UbiB kinase family protein, partial [Chloroflexi bacterium]
MKASSPPLRRRYRRILTFFLRAILTLLWWDLLVRRLLGARWVNRLARNRYRRIARQFRTLAVEMGGVLIKLGQFLSVHVELLPTEVTQELAGLQDEVPAEAFAEIRTILEEDLQAPLAQRFRRFEEQAHAAASLGQVHRACLPNGAEVMVKVQRSRIREMVETDLAALHTVIGWLQRYPPIRRRADLEALFEEFRRTLFEELDYLTEGRNAEQFAENFRGDPGVRVPAVHWSHTTRRVLTLEDVTAIKITDYAAIEAAGVSRQEVAQRLMETYLQQIFRDGFFHADPHPGNLFVQPLPWPEGGRGGESTLRPKDGRGNGRGGGRPFRLVFVDFGMVGRVTPEMW